MWTMAAVASRVAAVTAACRWNPADNLNRAMVEIEH